MKITLTKEQLKEKIEAIKALFTPAKSEPAESSYQLKDGTAVKCMGDLKPGSEFKVVTENGDQPAPDGDFEMEDGTVVKCAGGLITEVNPLDDDADKDGANDADATKKAMQAEITKMAAEHKTNLDALRNDFEAKIAKQDDVLSEILELVSNMAEMPAAEPIKKNAAQMKQQERLTKKEQLAKSIAEIRTQK